MSLKLVEQGADESQEAKIEAFRKQNQTFQDSFWETLMVRPGDALIGIGTRTFSKRVSIPELQKLNALLNSKEHFSIEHTYVPTPERAGVPIFEVATIQRRVYYATKLKLLRTMYGMLLCADGPHNGAAPSHLLLRDRQDKNDFYVLEGPERDLERAATERTEGVAGVIDCHKIFRMHDVEVTVSAKRMVIRYKGDYFPGELVITFNPKATFTLVGAEECRYAGSYTFVPTRDLKALRKLERSKKGHESNIRVKSKRSYLRY